MCAFQLRIAFQLKGDFGIVEIIFCGHIVKIKCANIARFEIELTNKVFQNYK